MFSFRFLPLLFAPVLASASDLTGLTFRLVTTDITGAQTQIDATHTSSWTFTTAISWTLEGGRFVMKDGPKTSDSIALTLWEGAANTGTQVAQINLTNAQFKVANPTDQSFSAVNYFFGPSYTLQAGTTYTLALTSAAPDAQNNAYFIKGSGWHFEDPTGTPLPADALQTSITTVGVPSSSTTVTATPEPSPAVLLFFGMVLIGIARSPRLRLRVTGLVRR